MNEETSVFYLRTPQEHKVVRWDGEDIEPITRVIGEYVTVGNANYKRHINARGGSLEIDNPRGLVPEEKLLVRIHPGGFAVLLPDGEVISMTEAEIDAFFTDIAEDQPASVAAEQPPQTEIEDPTMAIFTDIAAEREAQDAKWGGAQHDDAHAIDAFCEIIEQQNIEALEFVGAGEEVENPDAGFRRQMIRVAAVAVAAVESLDRVSARGEQKTQTGIVAGAGGSIDTPEPVGPSVHVAAVGETPSDDEMKLTRGDWDGPTPDNWVKQADGRYMPKDHCMSSPPTDAGSASPYTDEQWFEASKAVNDALDAATDTGRDITELNNLNLRYANGGRSVDLYLLMKGAACENDLGTSSEPGGENVETPPATDAGQQGDTDKTDAVTEGDQG